MTKPGSDIRYKRCRGIDVREVDGEAFFVSPVTKAVHHLNPSAAAFWRVLDEPRTFRDVSDIFASAFPETPRANINADLAKLCKELLRIGLIEPVIMDLPADDQFAKRTAGNH